MKRLIPSVIVVIAITAGSGCGGAGDEKVRVGGRVTFDGDPIEVGEIVFRSEDGSASAGGPITDGSFEFETKPGKMRVEITARRSTTGAGNLDTGEAGGVSEQYIPAKYNEKSELTTVVTEAASDLEFELEK